MTPAAEAAPVETQAASEGDPAFANDAIDSPDMPDPGEDGEAGAEDRHDAEPPDQGASSGDERDFSDDESFDSEEILFAEGAFGEILEPPSPSGTSEADSTEPAKSKSKPRSKSKSKTTPNLESQSKSKPKSKLKSEPKPKAEPEAEPEAEAPFALFVESSLATRHDRLKEALLAGSHVYCEHPPAASLREADELLNLSGTTGLRLTPDLPWRLDPALRLFHAERESLLGELLGLRVYGGADSIAGGRDLVLHGPALFDLVRWFAGEIAHCHAEITEGGMPVIAEDAREDEEGGLGLLLGDRIEAGFVTEGGVQVHYHSDSRLRRVAGPMGIEFIGQRGRMRWFAGPPSRLSLLVSSDPDEPERSDRWEEWPGKAELAPEESGGDVGESDPPSSREERVRRWLDEPLPGEPGELPDEALLHAVKALEMVHGVWQAGVTKRRAYFPLSNRLHPLAEESRE